MPALVLHGFRTKVAGDDLRPLVAFTVLIRVLQMLFLTPVIVFILTDRKCDGLDVELRRFSAMSIAYISGTYIFCTWSIVIGVFIFRIASKGTPTQPELRTGLVPLCTQQLFINPIFEMALVMLGITNMVYTSSGLGCKTEDDLEVSMEWYLFMAIVVWLQLIEVMLLLFYFVLVFVSNFVRQARGEENPEDTFARREAKWQRGCQVCCACCSRSCCFSFGGEGIEKEDFGSVSQTFADLFDGRGMLDVVFSDILMSWLLLIMVEKERRIRCLIELKEAIAASTDILDNVSADCHTLIVPDILKGILARLKRSSDVESNHTYEDNASEKPNLDLNDSASESNVDVSGKYIAADTAENVDTDYGEVMSSGGISGGRIRKTTYSRLGESGTEQDLDVENNFNDSSEADSNNNGEDIAILSAEIADVHVADETNLEIHELAKPLLSEKPRQQSLIYKAIFSGDEVHYEFEVRDFLSPNKDTDRYAIAEGAWFFKYPDAINAWKNYVFAHPCTGLCELCCIRCFQKVKQCKSSCRGSSEPENGSAKIVVGENIFGINETALMKVVGFDDGFTKLEYAHFDNSVEEATYCVVIDHRWKSVVLCIRGSLSLDDYVVDVSLDPKSLEDVGTQYGFDGSGEFCHRGALNRSIWIMQDLQRNGVLSRLLLGDSAEYKDYTLRIVGHSLGAACAAPVALMLRKEYPTLRCLCFGPPGGLFTMKTAMISKEFITTYVLNNDMVARLSVENLNHLRDEILELIARVKVPKYHVHRAYARGYNQTEKIDDLDTLLHPKSNIPESEFKRQLSEFKSLQKARKETRDTPMVPMYPPGRIVHMVKIGTSKKELIPLIQPMIQSIPILKCLFNCFTCHKLVPHHEYTPKWAENNDFNEIMISSSLISDHLTDTVGPALNDIAAAFRIETSTPPL